ncbi:hypothetical protein EKD04_004490 [Chloroflexales bacterium ZM16-3]|nr:hypothetical protein [Chloroflexales bacterium ZM16-3]
MILLFLVGCAAASPAPSPTTQSAPAPTAFAPQMSAVPDLRGAMPNAAADLLIAASLRLGEERTSCAAIGAVPAPQPGPPGSILCQAVTPGARAPADLAVDYVLYAGDR